MLRIICGFALATAAVSAAERPNLTGTWKGQSAAEVVEIQQVDGEISIKTGAEEIRCGTFGEECAIKIAGKPVKLTFYYNGPVLVEMRVENKRVVKTRRSLSEDGKTLTVEVMPISPPGSKTESRYSLSEGASATP